MNKQHINAIAAAIAFAFSTGAMATQALSKAEYKADKAKIEMDYKSAKAGCASLSSNAKDICVVEAKGKEKVAKAELEANYKPSAKSSQAVSIAKAEADYAVAKEKCDDKAGNDKDVCVKEAKAVEIKALADAKLGKQIGEAKKDAAADKLDADYKVAIEKCDALAGEAKNSCVAAAKAQFGKS